MKQTNKKPDTRQGRSPSRRSHRLKGYDYSQPGAYFVTICTRKRTILFGDVRDGVVVLSTFGIIARDCWLNIPKHFPSVELDVFVVMPNHLHGVVLLNEAGRGTACRGLTSEEFGKPARGSLPTIVRSYKSATTRNVNRLLNTPGTTLWQRNYFEHIIRSEKSFHAICKYIENNPLRWDMDRYNPKAIGRDPEALDLWNLLTTEGGINPI